MRDITDRLAVQVDEFCKPDLLESYFDRLYPICRSILGQGFRESLRIIKELVPFEEENIPSGSDVLDWTVPDEWNIEDAYIVTPSGARIAEFSKNNLHVVNYSEPVDREIDLEELKQHLHTLPDSPEIVPYVTSYYRRLWGFCIPHRLFESLEPGSYRAVIKSEIKPGKLVYGQAVIPGTTDREIFFSSYLCHPQMAVHELSGPLVQACLYRVLKATAPHRHTMRFLICPENIGAAAFLHNHGARLKEKIEAGYIINCVGHGERYTYKRSRQSDSLANRAALNVLRNQELPLEEVDFFPDGSDERQFCSPGFDLPVGLIMRTMYGRFPEYHTSADDKSLISFEVMRDTVRTYFDVTMTLEGNFTPIGRVQLGSPQLSKSAIPLYRDIMNYRAVPKEERIRVLLEILNWADGSKDLLRIAEERGFRLIDHGDLVRDLIDAGYIAEA